MKKVLITGINGFAASHLAQLLLEMKYEVHGTHRVRSDMYRLHALGIYDQIKYHLIELTDSISVYDVIKQVMPDQIYHLAAQDYVKSSWDSPHETFNTNVGGTINLFHAIKQCYPRITHPGYYWFNKGDASIYLEFPKILVTSTSETYGMHLDKINEETLQAPLNPYGISKLTQDQLSRLYAQAYGIPTVVTRSFNVTGWGRNDPFVDSNFAIQIVKIEKGMQDPIIRHGNLKTRRTFYDVRDAVRGYFLAMESKFSKGDVFCFGSDKSTSIEELLHMLINLSEVAIETEVDASRMRPIDTAEMRVDYSKAREFLGWKPVIPLEQSLTDLLNYWRERL